MRTDVYIVYGMWIGKWMGMQQLAKRSDSSNTITQVMMAEIVATGWSGNEAREQRNSV